MCSCLFNKAQDILIRAGVLFNPSPFTVEVRNVKFLSVKEGVEARSRVGGLEGSIGQRHKCSKKNMHVILITNELEVIIFLIIKSLKPCLYFVRITLRSKAMMVSYGLYCWQRLKHFQKFIWQVLSATARVKH